jgi:hypothetical protein
MDIRQGIIESANALGISPHDLATVISYETGGTFNPVQPGPTTKWGQHRGFLQFGEPQARAYGVNWNDPIGTQLGANGAVVRYLRDTGVRPGMGLLDVYSAVNAGGTGRYSARDMGTTVSQKVSSMGAHQAKASALFGGQFQPSVSSAATAFGGEPSPPPTFQSSLADEFSSLPRQQAGGSGGRRASTPNAPVDSGSGEPPPVVFASAAPEPARQAEPPAVARSTGGPQPGGLAELFQVGDIGLASSRAVDPRTGQPILSKARRSYG